MTPEAPPFVGFEAYTSPVIGSSDFSLYTISYDLDNESVLGFDQVDLRLDELDFSAVPEPGSLGLFAATMATLLRVRRCRTI